MTSPTLETSGSEKLSHLLPEPSLQDAIAVLARLVRDLTFLDAHILPPSLSGPEDMERGYRLLTRSDRLVEAFYTLYGDGKDLTPKQWRMLGAIQEAQQEVSVQFERWRDEAPPA